MLKCKNEDCPKKNFCGRYSKKALEQEVHPFEPKENSSGQLVCQHYVDKTKKSRIRRTLN